MAKKRQEFVSLEISNNAVKRIHLEVVEEEIFWKRADLVELPPKDHPEWADTVVKAIREILSGLEPSGNRSVGLILNSAQGWARLLHLPKMSFRELVDAISLQVKKDTPLSPEETDFKYHITRQKAEDKAANKFRVAFSCVPKSVTREQHDLLAKAEVRPNFEVFVPFSFRKWAGQHKIFPDGTFALLDMGARLTEINVYDGHRLQFSRKIPMGSETFNDALRSEGLVNFQGPPEELTRRRLSVTRPIFERFQGEIRRSLHYFTDEFRRKGPEQIFITGGGTRMEGIKEFLGRVLEMKIETVPVEQFAKLSDEVSQKSGELLRYTRLFLGTVGELDAKEVVPLEAKIPFTKLVAGLGILAVIISLGFTLQLRILESKIQAANRTVEELAPSFATASAVKVLEDEVISKQNQIDTFVQKEPYWEDLFVEWSHVIHEHVRLTRIDYGGGSFTLEGSYNQETDEGKNTIPNLLTSLSTGLFTKGYLVATRESQEKKGIFSFTITCEPVR